jgi:hypothetical protein
MQYETSYFLTKPTKYGSFLSNIAKMDTVNIKITLEEYDLQNVQEEKSHTDTNLLTVKNKFIEYYYNNTLDINNLLNQITYNVHFWVIINSIKWPDKNECDVLPNNITYYYNLRHLTINKIFIKKEIVKYEALLELVVTRILADTQFILSDINIKNLVYHIIFKGSDIYKLILKNRNIDKSYIDFYIYQYHNAYEMLHSM